MNGVAIPFALLKPTIEAKNFSPEFTATYRPTPDLTLFASWKKGFKSGSFNLAVPVALPNTVARDSPEPFSQAVEPFPGSARREPGRVCPSDSDHRADRPSDLVALGLQLSAARRRIDWASRKHPIIGARSFRLSPS